MENDPTCVPLHAEHTIRFDCEMSFYRDLLFLVGCVFSLWMEATNLTTINFQAQENEMLRESAIVRSQRYKHQRT